MTDLSAEAMSLRDNEAFQASLDGIRSTALEALVRTPATDVEVIRNHQAIVKVVDEIRGDLDAFIRAGRPKGAAGIA